LTRMMLKHILIGNNTFNLNLKFSQYEAFFNANSRI
jgi:hypothetical protein